jgi:hypothetical protein
MGIISLVISAVLTIFWLFMLLDMLKNDGIKGNDRILWFVGFVFLSLLAAGYYYFVQYKR